MQSRAVRLQRAAAAQEWVVTVGQLHHLGFTRAEVFGLVHKGHLHRIHRGVYAVGRSRLTQRGWLHAALLACGPGSFLSHRTAAGLRGVCGLNAWAIHVTVTGAGVRGKRGVTVHHLRDEPHPDEVQVLGGLRVATTARIFVDLAASESQANLERMLELAARRGILQLDKLDEAVARHPRAHGLAKLHAALAAYRPRPFDRSSLERSVAEAIGRHPRIPPPTGRNVLQEASGITWEIDFWWEEERVALETDGGQYHLTPRDLERDRIKDMKLTAAGIAPVRITDVRWELDPAGALDDLEAVIRSRRAASRQPPQAAA